MSIDSMAPTGRWSDVFLAHLRRNALAAGALAIAATVIAVLLAQSLWQLATGGASARAGIYLVDPHDEAILYYDEAAPAKAPLKDLKRLLKVSRSW